jgi:hypothetical protein
MRKYIQLGLMSGLLVGTFTLSAQTPAQQSAERTVADRDATYGRIKEFTAGQKLVVDINNAPDKNYDLAKERDVVVPQGLKVGDTVKITERDLNGKKTVNIAMDSTPGVQYGDPQK